ncbi:MAG: hypothetical protein WKF35_00680 [Ferruginibacter sp.]
MKYLNFTKAFASLALVSFMFSSCDKKESVDVIGDRGQTIVKILNGGTPGTKALAIDFVSTPTRIVGAEIRRDVPNNAELMKPLTVTIQDDTAAVRAAGFIPLNPAFFTISGEGVTKVGGQGGTYTVTFAPGEFAKQIDVVVPNATVLDPSSLYGLGFRILTATQGVITKNNVLIISVGAKNKYDGVYNVTGTFSDITNPMFFGSYPKEIFLVTTGASSVDVKITVNGELAPAYLFLNGTAGTFYGSFGLTMTFDPATDVITDLHNYYGDPSKAATGVGNPASGTGAPLFAASNTRRAVLDPSGINAYDAATKTVRIKYFLVQPSAVPVGPRSFFNEVWTYTGPR